MFHVCPKSANGLLGLKRSLFSELTTNSHNSMEIKGVDNDRNMLKMFSKLTHAVSSLVNHRLEVLLLICNYM